jgi:heme A synthase
MADAATRQRRFAPFAWGTLAYTLFVILFGAWVRITGSGAGCGQHWPTCHGEIVHRPESIETVIELTHRVTSSFDGLVTIALVVLAFRAFERGHWARKGAVLSLVFVILEGLIGAVLVKEELVADDDSVARAIVMAIHLVNTSLLTGAMAIAAWMGTHPRRVRLRPLERTEWLLVVGLIGMLLTSMTGAVTALGDTLYPVESSGSVTEHLAADHGLTAHFLQRARIFHPMMAIGLGAFLLYAATAVADLRPVPAVRQWAKWTIILVLAQVGAGVVNIMLSAPGWMQIVHLMLAKLLWLDLVLLTFAAAQARDE